ncbi:MAG: hypothetical protein GY786_15675 [Proteobacteria bacterium]|nr:hypothetical protein [Pseudomonadota bacterium]
MKKWLLPFLVLGMLMGTVLAQDEDNPTKNIYLESFERCNNWARHYCQAGDHEIIVNDAIKMWKHQGVQITTKRIRTLAQRIRQNLKLPNPEDE